MTVERDVYVRQLIARAKEGAIPREDDAGDVDETGVVDEPVQHGFVQAAPDAGSGPDQEPAVRS